MAQQKLEGLYQEGLNCIPLSGNQPKVIRVIIK